MHQQFLRAIGVMTATSNAALKLNRIHYLRPTKQEAAQAANTNHSSYRDLITLRNAELNGTSGMPTRDTADSTATIGHFIPNQGMEPFNWTLNEMFSGYLTDIVQREPTLHPYKKWQLLLPLKRSEKRQQYIYNRLTNT